MLIREYSREIAKYVRIATCFFFGFTIGIAFVVAG